MRSLLRSRARPYYIVAPPYTDKSAGIVAHHVLCHALNQSGQEAYVKVDLFACSFRRWTNPSLLTPLLTHAVHHRHLREGREPIVIYPEIVAGNPLGARSVVRYYCNKPGFLGGDPIVRKNEFNLAYSQDMLDGFPAADQILFVPVIDANLFKPPASPDTRRPGKVCYYRGRYREAPATSSLIGLDSIEITIKFPPRKSQLVQIFQECEYFVSYQSSSLCLEAALCGCVAVVIPNKLAPEMLGKAETGMHGMAWGESPDELARARSSLAAAREWHLRREEIFWCQLDAFIEKTQAWKSHWMAETHAGSIDATLIPRMHLKPFNLLYWYLIWPFIAVARRLPRWVRTGGAFFGRWLRRTTVGDRSESHRIG